MTTTVRKTLFLSGAILFLGTIAFWKTTSTTAAPRVDLKPIAHWIADSKFLNNKTLTDQVGKLDGRIVGEPRFVESAPTPCIVFEGPDDGIVLNRAATPALAILPKETMSVVSWVRIDESTEWGGIFGCMQDNGSTEHGFTLGFNRTVFHFGLATQRDGKTKPVMTYLTGKTPYDRGRWYHVAATYDGKQMRLYVNGKLDAESNAQSGPIAYADKAPLVIGRYQDDDENYPANIALKEVVWCNTALSMTEINAHYAPDQPLADLPAAAPGIKFVVEPYLQFGTRTSMTIMCESSVPTDAILEYGTKIPLQQISKSVQAATIHEIKLENLQPKTKYFYRYTCTTPDNQVLKSKILTFMTAVDPTDAWSFTVIGDTQRNPIVTGKVAKLMWERRPHFVIHNGDVVDDGANKKQWTDDLFKPCHELFSRVAVFPCIGNHEKNHANYYQYFSMPKPEYYYSYKYGNAEFFTVDTNKTRTLLPGTEQYDWLDKALAASDAKWKICYHHHPAYSSDENDYGDSYKQDSTEGDLRVRPLQKLYEKHHVDIVFNGHIHLYERSWPIRDGKVVEKDGVIHITSGGGGGGLESFAPTTTFFKAECRSDFHFCYVTVHNGTLHFKAFDQEGRLFDSMTLNK